MNAMMFHDVPLLTRVCRFSHILTVSHTKMTFSTSPPMVFPLLFWTEQMAQAGTQHFPPLSSVEAGTGTNLAPLVTVIPTITQHRRGQHASP